MKINVGSIHNFLEKEGLESVVVPRDSTTPFELIYIPMGVDERGRDLLLQIKIAEEDLSGSGGKRLSHGSHSSSGKCHMIQILLALPFLVKDECVGEVARLILLLNKSFSLPGFEFSEVDKLIYFRTAVMATDQLDGVVLMAVIGNLMAYVDAFADSLEDVAEGRKIIADIAKESVVKP
jgi:Family of unknown function (DUF1790).